MNQLSPFLQYSIKVAIVLALLYLPYRIFLARLTFYRSNRYYLLGCSMLSLLVPLFNLGPVLPTSVNKYGLYVDRVTQYHPAGPSALPQPAQPLANHSNAVSAIWHTGALLEYLLIAGMALMLIRLLVQAVSLLRVKHRATLLPGNTSKGVLLYSMKDPIAPFSFGKNVFVHLPSLGREDLDRIVEHETVHVRQHHTLDILFMQLLMVFQWWNPFVWVLDQSVRQNLEFLADESAAGQGVDRKQYQYLLLKVSGISTPQLCNAFNFSPLKTRIAMMNKQRSPRVQVARFLFVLPLLFVLLAAFSEHRPGPMPGDPTIHQCFGFVVDSKTLQPLEGVIITERFSGLRTITDDRGYFRIILPLTYASDTLNVKAVFDKEGMDEATSSFSLLLKRQEGMPDYRGGTIEFIGMNTRGSRNGSFSDATNLSPEQIEALSKNDPAVLEQAFKKSVDETKESHKVQNLIGASDKIFYVIDGKTYLTVDGESYISEDDLTEMILVDGKIQMTGDELNKRYTRDQLIIDGNYPAASALKKFGINKDVLAVNLRKKP